ncbi:MAG: UDP-N-acetylglucosamine 1-carboxyvinyltransferase, partial [Clostridia bacterium]|nr:UDP-N-acetylglucosamine 1-carboxyvinyltransferase [Clostridia bacterium]
MKKNCFEIKKCNGLYGKIKNQTSKNATLPIMSASLLCDEKVKILETPNITDVDNMIKLLKKIGVKIKREGRDILINPKTAEKSQVNCELAKTMRSSLFLLGSLLAKFKQASIFMPGGCEIGKRPIDIHIDSLKKLGVQVSMHNNCFCFDAKNAKAGVVKLKIPSVGATENIIQFACKLKGVTTIINPAKEPEIVDLCNFLNQMGAKILGAGTNKITIYGVDKLNHTEYKPIGDRIVVGTILCAVALCGGDVEIINAVPYQNLKLIKIMRSMGCQISYKNDIIHIIRDKNLVSAKKISTGYYPKFATDLQSLMLALSCLCEGKTTILEKVFENRFLIVPELIKMGADIKIINSHKVIVNGVENLNGCSVEAKDLRGGASLVLAGLVAKGKTTVNNIHFIDRGYDGLEKVLSELGANIRRI